MVGHGKGEIMRGLNRKFSHYLLNFFSRTPKNTMKGAYNEICRNGGSTRNKQKTKTKKR